MKKKVILIFTIFVALVRLQAQERPAFIEKNYDYFTTDIHDNLYLWKDMILEKYNSEGEMLYHYSNPAYGTITCVDAKIPSKIMVFFQESGKIIFLDNTLSSIGNPLNLLDNNLYSITLAAILSTNQIALFDDSQQRLLITDLNLKKNNEITLNFSTDIHPTEISINTDKEIILLDTAKGLFFFDQFGSITKKISFYDISSINYWEKFLYYLKDSRIYRYDLTALDNTLLVAGLTDIKVFKRTKQYLYYLDHSGKTFRDPIQR